MFAPRLALLLCLMLPLPGFAQDSTVPEQPVPSLTPPPLVPAPPDSQDSSEDAPEDAPQDEIIPREWTPQRASSPTGPRLALEVFGGALGGALGIIPGGLLVLSALCFDGCDDGAETRGILGLALGLTGFVGGMAGGIVGAASLVHGEGAYWPTVGGTAIGALAGILCGVLVADSAEEAALIPAITGPILGGMIGYELSHSNAASRGHRSLASGTRVMPVVSALPSGGLLGGLVGSF